MTETNDPYSGMEEEPGLQPPPSAPPVGPPPGAAPVGPPPSAAPVGPPLGQAPVGPPPGEVPQYSAPAYSPPAYSPPPGAASAPASPPPVGPPPAETPTSTDVWGTDPTQVMPTAPAVDQTPPGAYPGTGYQAEIPPEPKSQKGRIFAILAIGLIALVGAGVGAFMLLGGDSDDDTASETTATTVAAAEDGTESTDVETTEADSGQPADAPTFVDIFDDSGFLFASVPDDWVVEGESVSGSENLKASGDQGELLMFPLITEVTPAEQIAVLIDGWECEMDGTPYDYDDGLFTGVGAKYTCPGAPKFKGEALVVVHPEGDRILVDTFMTGGDESDAIRRKIFESFNLKLN